jgi:hypothetical protein
MAEVLREYVDRVRASDVFDYGAGGTTSLRSAGRLWRRAKYTDRLQ